MRLAPLDTHRPPKPEDMKVEPQISPASDGPSPTAAPAAADGPRGPNEVGGNSRGPRPGALAAPRRPSVARVAPSGGAPTRRRARCPPRRPSRSLRRQPPRRQSRPRVAPAPAPLSEEQQKRDRLSGRLMETEALLRVPVHGADALLAAKARIEEALGFLEALAALAAREEMNEGMLFQKRFLCRVPPGQLGRSGRLLPSPVARTPSPSAAPASVAPAPAPAPPSPKQQDERPSEADALLTRAQRMLALVRIKVEDRNDLNLVRRALKECAGFFDDLQAQARLEKREEHEVLAGLRFP